ncbi:hypothetical protein EJB05_20421, partial [Eragrostis curvula]
MATQQALSASALERIQLHMRLQGLYGAFGCAADSAAAAAQQWPKLETLLASSTKLLPAATEPVDAVATTVTAQHHHPQHVVDQTLAAGGQAAVDADQQLGSTGAAAYMPCSFERPEQARAEVASGLMVNGGYGGGAAFGSHHDELYDFLYNKYGSLGAGAHGGGHIPSLPELQCPDGADEKFSMWATSCEYGVAGQIQGNSIGSLQDYALGGYDQ